MPRRCWLLAASGFVFLTGTTSAQSPKEQELLQFVESAHKSSRELIRTSYCRVRFEITAFDVGKPPAPTTQTCNGEYWHAADAARLKVTEDGETAEYVWKNSVRDVLIYKADRSRQMVAATRAGFTSRYLHRCDAWVRGLLVINDPQTGDSIPFEQLREKASKVVKVERKSIEGVEMVVVRLRFDRKGDQSLTWEVETFFDPRVNYLVRKVVRTPTTGRLRLVEEVVKFKNCGVGVFFPEEISGGSGQGDAFDQTKSTAVLSDIRVNAALPPDIFRLRFPNGIYLTDSIRGTSYRVDPDGKPTSPEKALGKDPPPAPSRLAGPEQGGETVEEPKPLSRWILPVSAGLILVGLVLAIRRRRSSTH